MARRVKKEAEVQGQLPTQPAAAVEGFAGLWPEITWQLQSPNWGNGGGKREQGSLSIFPQDGLWKVALRERSMGQVVFLSGATVHEALTRLETALREHSLTWRPDKYARPSSNGS